MITMAHGRGGKRRGEGVGGAFDCATVSGEGANLTDGDWPSARSATLLGRLSQRQPQGHVAFSHRGSRRRAQIAAAKAVVPGVKRNAQRRGGVY